MPTSLVKNIVRVYLGVLARTRVLRSQSYVVVVSGINGKTTTKRAIYDALKDRNCNVFMSEMNYNTDIGLPLTILGLTPPPRKAGEWAIALCKAAMSSLFGKKLPEFLVVEFGIADKGDMNKLLTVVKPNITVVTNTHYSDFNPNTTLDELAHELSVLAAATSTRGLVVLGGDNAYVDALRSATKARTVTFGFEKNNDIVISKTDETVDGTTILINNKEYTVASSGNNHFYAFTAAQLVSDFIFKKIKE
ncbi:MAG: Mur ligase family protein [Patescibacteria group bacterium]|jgi:UDP-N-acetylmuramoyl-tripeptide--D-alanyl-D-alanine ligase